MQYSSLTSGISSPNPSFFPKKMQILSGSFLKVFASIIMLIDHTAAALLSMYPPAVHPWFIFMGKSFTFYRVCRNIGRLAFPIYCFLIVEGFEHTSNRLRYAVNLLIFALLSEMPWNIALGRAVNYEKQNVFFTLLLGFIAMCLIEYFEGLPLMQTLCMFAILLVSIYLKADYSYRGYILLMIMYWLRKERSAQALIASSWLYYEWVAGFAFIPINMYNGERGFIRSRKAKYFFYLFYPLHLTILILLRKVIFGVYM